MADDTDARVTYLREQFQASVQGFRTAASAGSFGISEQAGQAIIKAIHDVQDGLEAARDAERVIQQETKLGTSPDAQVLAAFNKEVASGSNSAVSSLRDLREALEEVEAGINEAMRRYHEIDADNASGITRSGQ